jgi:hypothetical protein
MPDPERLLVERAKPEFFDARLPGPAVRGQLIGGVQHLSHGSFGV